MTPEEVTEWLGVVLLGWMAIMLIVSTAALAYHLIKK